MDELVRVRKVGFACALAVAVGIAAAIAITSLGQGSRGPRETNSPLWEGYGELPLAFEPNRGQAEAGVAFVAHGAGSTVSLRPTEALLSLGKRGSVRLQINGANRQSVLVPERRLQGKVNYLLGNDRSRWLSGIPTYGRLRANAVYPGIDLVYYGRQGRLEYDFLVHPGADPRTISLALMGARSLRLEGNGDLRLRLAGGELRQLAPRLYQQVGGERRRVEGRFVVRGRRLGFAVGTYDRSRTLVIDPTLAYSTYLGGSSADLAYGIALDASGNAYVTGPTESAAFPTAGAYQGTRAGFGDAFVTKLNASGSALVYSTYLGGSRYESGSSIAVDAGGNAYVTGSTSSTDFPTASPYQAAAAGAGDAFVTKLNATGSALVYSTYVGGADIDIPYRIAVDSAGNAYVTGQTRSIDFPTENSYQSSLAGFYDAFVTKLNATGSALVYSTYLGGGASTSRRASPSMRARTRMSPGRRPRRTSRQRALSRRRTAAATTLS